MKKVYKVRWTRYGSTSQWHSGDAYNDFGVFTSKVEAKKWKDLIESKKDKDGRQEYQVLIKEVELNKFDEFYFNLLELGKE